VSKEGRGWPHDTLASKPLVLFGRDRRCRILRVDTLCDAEQARARRDSGVADNFAKLRKCSSAQSPSLLPPLRLSIKEICEVVEYPTVEPREFAKAHCKTTIQRSELGAGEQP
jgi:hypothetical protein